MEKQEEKEFEKKEALMAEEYKKLFRHPATKVVLGAVGVLILMYSSKYFLNAGADMIRSYKRLKSAINS